MLLLGIDFETTLCSSENNYEKTFIIEAGAALYDWETKVPVEIISSLIKPYDKRIKVNGFITELTGISMSMLKKHGHSIKPVLKKISSMAKKSDFIVGHNIRDFDNKILLKECKNFDIDFPQRPCIDTLKDVNYPKVCKYKNLTYLSGFHGIIGGGHRAVFDVFSMMKILTNYNIKEVIENSKKAKIKIVARLEGAEAGRAKKLGFKYNPSKGYWAKKIKKIDFEKMKSELKFNYEIRE
ncbi:MAG: 3'-5' exonuclease [Candidatus Muiribacteriota bacterium]